MDGGVEAQVNGWNRDVRDGDRADATDRGEADRNGRDVDGRQHGNQADPAADVGAHRGNSGRV